MNLDFIQLDYSPWLIPVCIVLGIIYAVFLYRKSRLWKHNAGWKVYGLAILRALVVAIVAFLLLGPVIRFYDSHTEDPRVVVAIDNSQSVIAENIEDSAEVSKLLGRTLQLLNRGFNVDTLQFSDDVHTGLSLNFNGEATDISHLIEYVKTRYEGIPLSGLVLISDGIYNQGSNPIYSIAELKIPIYTIPLGDTTMKSDIKILQVLHNEVAYLGDEFPIEVDILGEKLKAQSHLVQLYEIKIGEKKLLDKKSLEFKDGSYFSTISFRASADEVGVEHLRLVIPPIAGELTTSNNYKDIFIDVIDSRQKIAILGASPHPDIGALFQSLMAFDNYKVDEFIIGDKGFNPRKYDLVILHQLPSRQQPATDIIKQLNESNIPIIWVVGTQSDLKALNRVQDVVKIQQRRQQYDQVQAYPNPSFSYFEPNQETLKDFSLYPPVEVPYAEFTQGPGTQVLLKQRIAEIETDKPLILISDYNNKKSAVITGEGLWRWRMYDYLKNNTHELFHDFVSRIVKYVGTRKDLRKFRVNTVEDVYLENEEVRFDAYLYNDAYQPITTATVTLKITSGERQYDFTFTPTERSYKLEAGYYEPGTYIWYAETTFDGSIYKASGKFIVKEVKKEELNLEADHKLLAYLAHETGGKVWNRATLEEDINVLNNSPYGKKVQYSTERNRSLISLSWLCGILLLLLFLEWTMRRILGDY